MRRKPKKGLKKIAKFHLIFSSGLFIFYIALSLIYSPEFLLSDIRGKFRALADDTITIVAIVLGPPEKPVVTGEAVCENEILSIELNWADDENSESFDIDRGGLPLVTGLVSSQYSDEAVASNTSYTYMVTAYGSMGNIASDEVIIATGECQGAEDDTEEDEDKKTKKIKIIIRTIENINIASHPAVPPPIIENDTPRITGTTSIPKAKIKIEIYSDKIVGTTRANSAGYWSWKVPVALAEGYHKIIITTIDPDDSSRTSTASAIFRIFKGKIATGPPSAGNEARIPGNLSLSIFLNMWITVENADKTVYSGDELKIKTDLNLNPVDFSAPREIELNYAVTDMEDNSILEQKEKVFLTEKKQTVFKNILIPRLFEQGNYKVKVKTEYLGEVASAEDGFFTKEPLILKLGGGFIATYPELLSKLGTASLWLLLCLIIWLILFSREYWLQLHALRHITEKNLAKIGLFGAKKRKEVSR